MLEFSCITHVMSRRLQCSLKKQTYQDMLETTWITHVMSAAAQHGNQTCQDTVENHLNQWWNVICRWGGTSHNKRRITVHHRQARPEAFNGQSLFGFQFVSKLSQIWRRTPAQKLFYLVRKPQQDQILQFPMTCQQDVNSEPPVRIFQPARAT